MTQIIHVFIKYIWVELNFPFMGIALLIAFIKDMPAEIKFTLVAGVVVLVIAIFSAFIIKKDIPAEVKVTLIAGAVTLFGAFSGMGGYIYNARKERDLEFFKIKAEAYSNFVIQIEYAAGIDVKKDAVLQDNTEIRKLNMALGSTIVESSDCVLKELKLIFNNSDKFDFEERSKVKKILHDDLNGKLKCDSSPVLAKDYPLFPYFYK